MCWVKFFEKKSLFGFSRMMILTYNFLIRCSTFINIFFFVHHDSGTLGHRRDRIEEGDLAV